MREKGNINSIVGDINNSNLIIDIDQIKSKMDLKELINILNYAGSNEICYLRVKDNWNIVISELKFEYEKVYGDNTFPVFQNIDDINGDVQFIDVNYYDCTKEIKSDILNIKNQGKLIVAKNIDSNGKLIKLDDYHEKLFKKLDPWETTVSWALRWVLGIEGIDFILIEPDSIKTLQNYIHVLKLHKLLDNSEWNYLIEIGEELKQSFS